MRLIVVAALAAVLSGNAIAQPALTRVAGFDQQVTGVAVSKAGRVFVNFPRWERDVPVSVAEVMPDGTTRAYPDEAWNAYRNAAPRSVGDHFVCVQSVVVDPKGFLWVLDPAAPGNEFVKPGGPKLVKIDLATNKVVQVIHFDEKAAPQGSYLNDVRFSPDAGTAYLTDSGQRGALLAVDLASGKAARFIDGDATTQVEPGVLPMVDGHELRRSDGRLPSFAADGIAIDAKGEYVYWQALLGQTLYRIRTSALVPPGRPVAYNSTLDRRGAERVGTTHVADGLWMDEQGYLFITDPAHNAVEMRAPDGTTTVVAKDDRLRWPDSLAEGADGSIYVTASHIQDMAQFHEHGSAQQGAWELFRIERPHPR